MVAELGLGTGSSMVTTYGEPFSHTPVEISSAARYPLIGCLVSLPSIQYIVVVVLVPKLPSVVIDVL